MAFRILSALAAQAPLASSKLGSVDMHLHGANPVIRIIHCLCVLLVCLAPWSQAGAGQNAPVDRLLRVAEDVGAEGQRRMAAIHALGERGDPRAVEPLIRILERDMRARTGVWAAAIPALGMLGDPAAGEILTSALNKRDDNWLGREMAAEALGRIGDASAVPALVHAARMADTRESAIAALARIGTPASAPSLIEALDANEPAETRQRAMDGLRRIGRPAVGALSRAALEAYPEAPMTDKRVALCRLLREISGSQARKALRGLATDSDPRVRACARGAAPFDHPRQKQE